MSVFRPVALQSVTAINPKKDLQIFISLGTLSSFSVTEIYRKTTESWSIFDKFCVVSRIIVRNEAFLISEIILFLTVVQWAAHQPTPNCQRTMVTLHTCLD